MGGSIPLRLVAKVNDPGAGELIDFVNESQGGIAVDARIRKQAEIFRRFNRFYMQKLQPLRDAMKGPSLHPNYLRVLRELGEAGDGVTASWIAHHLAIDAGHVCRIIAWYRALGYLHEREHPRDRRSKLLRLNQRGRTAYERKERAVTETAELMVALVPEARRHRFVSAMLEIQSILREARWDGLICPSSDPGCD